MPLTRGPANAILWAMRQQTWAPHSCLNFVKNAYYGDAPTQNAIDGKPYLANAIDGWNNSTQKHPKSLDVPDGALMYFAGAHPGDPGDVQIKTPNNTSRRTDVGEWGRVGTTDMMWMQDVVGREYLGWTGDILGYPYFDEPQKEETVEEPSRVEDDEMAAQVIAEDSGKHRIIGAVNGAFVTFGSKADLTVFLKGKPTIQPVTPAVFDKLVKKVIR